MMDWLFLYSAEATAQSAGPPSGGGPYTLGLVIGLGLILAVMLFYEGLRLYLKPPLVKEKLAQYAMLSAEELARKQSYFQRRVRPLARRVAPNFEWIRPLILRGDVSRKLAYAGRPGNLTVDEFYGVQIMAGLGALLVFTPFSLSQGRSGLPMMLAALLFGLFYPLIWLDSRAKERQRKISRAVPDLLDMLTICVEAGLGFDQALHHILQRMEGPLAEEMTTFMNELQMGLPRQSCFERLRDRNSSSELHIVVTAIVQSQELGVPIAKTLQEQAQDMRVRRLQRAREEGAKASPKISLITTILVAPSAMCLFLAVLLYNIFPQISQSMQLGPGP
jgi:tight adherence protein C